MAAIGIDVGTHEVRVAVFKDGCPILSQDGKRVGMPAIVAFDDNQRLIGQDAYQFKTSPTHSVIEHSKQLVGKSCDGKSLEQRSFLASSSQNVQLKAENNSFVYHLKFRGEPIKLRPVQVLAELLIYARQHAIKNLGIVVGRAAIGIPAYFTNRQRVEYLVAAELAGLTHVRLVNETTASALNFAREKAHTCPSPRVLVVDSGSHSINASLVEIYLSTVTVINSFTSNIGGVDIDTVLVENFSREVSLKLKINVLEDPDALRKLTAACQTLKTILSNTHYAVVTIKDMKVEGSNVNIKMSRDEFEALVGAVLKKALITLCQASSDLPHGEPSFTDILLTGGSSKIPVFKKVLQDVFPTRQIHSDVEESVVKGLSLAAFQSFVMPAPSVLVQEISSRSFALHANSMFSIYMPRKTTVNFCSNLSLPASSNVMPIRIFENDEKLLEATLNASLSNSMVQMFTNADGVIVIHHFFHQNGVRLKSVHGLTPFSEAVFLEMKNMVLCLASPPLQSVAVNTVATQKAEQDPLTVKSRKSLVGWLLVIESETTDEKVLQAVSENMKWLVDNPNATVSQIIARRFDIAKLAKMSIQPKTETDVKLAELQELSTAENQLLFGDITSSNLATVTIPARPDSVVSNPADEISIPTCSPEKSDKESESTLGPRPSESSDMNTLADDDLSDTDSIQTVRSSGVINYFQNLSIRCSSGLSKSTITVDR